MSDKRQQHNVYQRRTFDKTVEAFRQRIPDDIGQRMERIVAAARLTADDRVLDVGTGIGVLIHYIQHYGVRYIVGCDLSPAMLAEARARYPGVHFWCGDVIDAPRELGPYDVVFFNAVFGNVWDQRDTLRKTSIQLTQAGRIIISHPMGATFVEELRHDDTRLIPHPLPGENQLANLIQGLPFEVKHFQDDEQLYLCVLQHVRSTTSSP